MLIVVSFIFQSSWNWYAPLLWKPGASSGSSYASTVQIYGPSGSASSSKMAPSLWCASSWWSTSKWSTTCWCSSLWRILWWWRCTSIGWWLWLWPPVLLCKMVQKGFQHNPVTQTSPLRAVPVSGRTPPGRPCLCKPHLSPLRSPTPYLRCLFPSCRQELNSLSSYSLVLFLPPPPPNFHLQQLLRKQHK